MWILSDSDSGELAEIDMDENIVIESEESS